MNGRDTILAKINELAGRIIECDAALADAEDDYNREQKVLYQTFNSKSQDILRDSQEHYSKMVMLKEVLRLVDEEGVDPLIARMSVEVENQTTRTRGMTTRGFRQLDLPYMNEKPDGMTPHQRRMYQRKMRLL